MVHFRGSKHLINTTIFVCAAERWKSTKETERKHDSFENNCLRKIIVGHKMGRVLNNGRDKKFVRTIICIKIDREKMDIYIIMVHLCKRENTKIPSQALDWEIEGKRKKNHLRETLKRNIIGEPK